MKGLFITIEGIDGSGKSTQVKHLVSYLEKKGYEVVVTREPGGTKISENIRDIILNPEHDEMNYITETLLYAASRAQHVNEKIIPAIQAGKIVICDRFLDSSFAYQGYGRNIPINLIETVNAVAINNMMPHLTLFFSIPFEVSMERKKAMKSLDRIEKEKKEFYEKVYNGYIDICQKHSQRIKIVDATGTIEQVHENVIDIIKNYL